MNLLQMHGGSPQKQPRYVPIFQDRFFTGIWTQRSVLHDPSDVISARFYGGRPDALLDGSNIELTNRLTLQRRPGLSQFSIATYPTPPNRCFSFSLTNGTIQVIVDTGSTPMFNFSGVTVASGVAFYNFTTSQPTAANNAFVGLLFQVAGFDNGVNNGTFVCDGSTSSHLILRNPNAQMDVGGTTQLASDSFTVATPNLTTYGTWTPEGGLGGNSLGSVGGATRGPGGDAGDLYTGFALWPNDQYSQASVARLAETVANNTVTMRLAVRGSTSAMTEYRLQLDATSPNIGNGHDTAQSPSFSCQALASIIYMNAGVPTTLTSMTLNVGSLDVFKLQVVGTALKAFQNGTQILSATDGNIAAGKPGLGSNTPGGGEQNNAEWSSWSGGQAGNVINATGISAGAVYVDQQNSGTSYGLSSVQEVSGVAYYFFSSPQSGAASNGFVGQIFNVTGFNVVADNGQFVCLFSTSTYMILDNELAQNDTNAGATATSIDKILLFPKNPGAGQTYFVGVAGILYMGDGIDIRKYTPGNPNGIVWNWGTPAPTNQPSVSIVASGSAATQWAATTVFSTMGLIVDPNGRTQQLFSVNASGNNPPPATLGTSGPGIPPLTTTLIPGSAPTTMDGTVTWTCAGPITLWKANTFYVPGQIIYDPVTNCVFAEESIAINIKSGPTKPNFTAALFSLTDDTLPSGIGINPAVWKCLGVPNNQSGPTATKIWQKSAVFNTYNLGAGLTKVNSAIVYPVIPTLANLTNAANGGPQVFFFGATTGGTTANVNYTPWTGIPMSGPNSQNAGAITQDIDAADATGLLWLCLGSSQWASSTQYIAWTAPFQIFNAIKDPNNNMQVCIVPGESGTIQPTWKTNFKDVTLDNQVQWINVGNFLSWTSNTQWQLPLPGFSPPSLAQPFGSSEVVGATFVQAVIASGLSNSSPPNWSTTVGNTTQDNFVTWETVAKYSQQSLVWTKGHVYAYSFAARLTSDPFNTSPPPGFGPQFATGVLTNGLGSPTGSETGLISTASPVFTITGANAGAVNTVSGLGSTDPQVDTIIIWRDADGGGSSNMFFLTEIPAPPPIGGVAQPWSFQDFLPDVATTVGSGVNAVSFPGLNAFIPAPINHENDPPPSDFLPMVFNFQRIWGADGSDVLFSGGPDVLTGNPNEAFNPSDDFPYLAPVIRVVKNSQGLVILLTDSIEFIGGGPETASFYSVTLAPGIGLLSYNFLDVYAGEIYFLSADGQLKVINPSLQLSNAGFPIGDKLAALNPATGYLAVQQAGVDNAIYVADGSTGWWRCNPHQVPGGPSGPEPIWSPFASIVGGAMMVQSVEVAPGIKKLLVGGTQPNQHILFRDLTVSTDNNAQYDAFFTIGAIMLAHQGEIAILSHVAADFSGVNFKPAVSYLIDEISGPFTTIGSSVFDPPSQYGGTNVIPSSYSPLRFYFKSTGTLARCRHIQLRIDLGVTPNPDEIMNLCIVGRLMVEV